MAGPTRPRATPMSYVILNLYTSNLYRIEVSWYIDQQSDTDYVSHFRTSSPSLWTPLTPNTINQYFYGQQYDIYPHLHLLITCHTIYRYCNSF